MLFCSFRPPRGTYCNPAMYQRSAWGASPVVPWRRFCEGSNQMMNVVCSIIRVIESDRTPLPKHLMGFHKVRQKCCDQARSYSFRLCIEKHRRSGGICRYEAPATYCVVLFVLYNVTERRVDWEPRSGLLANSQVFWRYEGLGGSQGMR